MTTPRDRMPPPLPPSDARVEVTPEGFTLFGTPKWRLRLIHRYADMDLGIVYGSREKAAERAHTALRRHLLPDPPELPPGSFTVRGMPRTGPGGRSGQARAR